MPKMSTDYGHDFGYISHFAVLAAALAKTTGPVLELGMGWGSTPMLHAICQAQNRWLMSVETNPEWVERFRDLAMSGHDMLLECGSWRDIPLWDPPTEPKKFAVAFIDFAPGEARKDLAMKLKGKAKFIILHDAECDGIHGGGGNYQYQSIVENFKYVEYYRLLRPVTLILSDDEPFGLSAFEKGEHADAMLR